MPKDKELDEISRISTIMSMVQMRDIMRRQGVLRDDVLVAVERKVADAINAGGALCDALDDIDKAARAGKSAANAEGRAALYRERLGITSET